MTQRRIAVTVLLSALALDALLGVLYGSMEHLGVAHGLYCALGNAVTEGACTAPVRAASYVINAIEFMLVVPLVAAVFSLFTSALTAHRVHKTEHKIIGHLEHMMHHHGMPKPGERTEANE